MFSLYSNCVGIVGVIGNQVVISTQKIGSTTISRAAKESAYFNQDNFGEIIKTYLSKPGVNDFALLFIRDPLRKLITGAVENIFAPYAHDGLYHGCVIDQDLVFSNSKKLMACRKFMIENANDWFRFGVPKEHGHIITTIAEVYFTVSVNKEIFYQPHVMPFFTSIHKLLINHDVKFKTSYLKDFDFRLTKGDLKKSKHSNEAFVSLLYEAYNNVKNEYIHSIIHKERQTIKDLEKFYYKPSIEVL